jgi:hypothetical protein
LKEISRRIRGQGRAISQATIKTPEAEWLGVLWGNKDVKSLLKRPAAKASSQSSGGEESGESEECEQEGEEEEAEEDEGDEATSQEEEEPQGAEYMYGYDREHHAAFRCTSADMCNRELSTDFKALSPSCSRQPELFLHHLPPPDVGAPITNAAMVINRASAAIPTAEGASHAVHSHGWCFGT